jgi:S-formylglutathione hydrolase FrmB
MDLDVKTAADVNLRIQLASVALLWVAIRLRLFMPNQRNRQWWLLTPLPLAALVVGLMRTDPTPELPGFQESPAGFAAPPARAANRFGTPLPRDAAAQAAARRFGTPLPRDAARVGAPAPGAVATPRPFDAAPDPLPAPADSILARPQDTYGAARPSEYVGETQGIFRERTFYTPALDREMPYYVYLPPLYGAENRRYPVLYMLHGGGQHRDEWPAYGFVDAADRMMASKELHPFIIVLPQGDYSYWLNHPDDGERWGDYVAFDLVRQVDSSFRTLPTPDKRAIGGLSMGGLGALHLSFLHPDVFRNVAAHSPALYPDDGSMPLLGQGEDFAARDPVLLALSQPEVEHLDIAIDIGEEDYFIERAMELHDALDLRGIPHAFNVLPGVHGDGYWERNIINYLRLYDSMLNWR